MLLSFLYILRALSLLLILYSQKIQAAPIDDSEISAQSEPRIESPVVDLGYALYRPTSFNATGQYYNFSNIRYAAPPVGNLRWRDPQPPLEDRKTVNDGKLGYICLQSVPGYFADAGAQVGPDIAAIPPGLPGQSQSEDCLFLDVIAPTKLFKEGQKKNRKLAPVLVNIHGGGFFGGDKTAIYSPTGLLERAKGGFVYVSMGYRLGAFGFLSNLGKSDANYTSPNAGLLDQRFALKWVQKNIHLFGGDATNVTITGESAGGGSVEYHTVAYGGAKDAENKLFARGIAQSPAPITTDPNYARLGANTFLQLAGVRSVDEARRLPAEVLQKANVDSQNSSNYDVEYFAPTVDGDLIPDIPARLYNTGRFIKKIDMIAGHNADEGRLFGNKSTKTEEDFNFWVKYNFRSAPQAFIDRYINEVYPPKFDGSLPYTTQLGRIQLATKEYLISCNTYSIARAYNFKAYNYLFSIPPAIHAQDLAYTYYPTGATPGFYPDIAIAFQKSYTSFVLTGNPNGKGAPSWPEFGKHSRVLYITTTGLVEATSDAANERCKFLLEGSYYPQPKQGST